ncbi:hypothetical protein BHM03_00031489 [Ensete ventricosum]|uniref:Uncharacterized protein n=1 Tax=Ensete ventricosum TaxID=4639 RepID=A0A445MIM8_ENSVE|nr:hypothetical protein BHM03_00031489 [Ensete ventricosum]
MRSFFNVDSIVTTRRLTEVRKNYFVPPYYELHAPLPGEHPYDVFPSGFSLSTDALEAGLSTTRVPVEKEEPVETEEAPERGYTLRELCEVNCAGAEKYFTTNMVLLKAAEGEDPLVPRWSAISGSSQVWTEGPLAGEYLRGAPHPILAKQVYECSSEELINKADRSAFWLAGSELAREDLALRFANKELKHGASQDLVAVVEFRVKVLEEDANKLRVELESLKS